MAARPGKQAALDRQFSPILVREDVVVDKYLQFRQASLKRRVAVIGGPGDETEKKVVYFYVIGNDLRRLCVVAEAAHCRQLQQRQKR